MGYVTVTESRLALLAAQQANNSGDEVLRRGIRLYLESWQTEKIADSCLKRTILSGFGCQFLL